MASSAGTPHVRGFAQPVSTPSADDTAAMIGYVGRSKGWLIGFGALTLAAGILVLVWPGASLLVIAVILGLQLLVTGVFWVVGAFTVDESRGGSRGMLALIGVLAILVGILILRHPFQTLGVLALLLGLYWTVSGVIEIVHGIGGQTAHRGWVITAGVIGLIAGILVLVYPGLSLAVMVWLFGALLVVYGALAIARGFMTPKAPAPPEPRATA